MTGSERMKKTRDRRRVEGRCVKCGEVRRSDAHRVKCGHRKRYAPSAASIETTRRSNLARKKKARAWVNAYKATLKCQRCPENHPACLDFHHWPGEAKKYNIAVMVNAGFPIAKILAEIAKCEVVCSNCHRKIHWAERQAAA